MFSRSLLALFLSCVASFFLALGLALYAHYVEPYWVQETHWELSAKNWQGRPLRLAVIADLHAKSGDGDYVDSIVRRTLEAKPDAVLLLGDYINEPRLGESMELEVLAKHLAPLAQLPCYAVLGNHDHGYGADAIRAMLQGFGARLVEGRAEALEIGGDTLYLAGVRCLCHYDTPGEIAPLPQGKKRATYLLLSHSPAGAHYAPLGATATIAAHTHGGQVCLPGGVPIIKPDSRVEWREMKGAFMTAEKPVYVTRGLGTSMMPLRFWCRPELTFVELGKKR